jgi:hypothetical protein
MVSEQNAVVANRSPNSLRSALVTFGPSLLLIGFAAAATVATMVRLVRYGPGRGRLGIAALGALAPWAYLLAIRPWVLHWGARPDELARQLPGDDLVPEPVWMSTRAVSIATPGAAVWPWLAQMGQDKGGLYSYTWLENLAGLAFRNADRIHPEWQAVAPGDLVRLAPDQDALTVARVEPNRALVWQILDPRTQQPAPATWAFVLEPDRPGHTRLIQRFRMGGRPGWLLGAGYTLLVEIPHFVMERRMLVGIRERAERAWQAGNRGERDAPGR